MKNLIFDYVQSNKLSWSITTQSSELSRLYSVAKFLDGNPDTLWSYLQLKAPYTRCTTWIRVIAFWDWQLEQEKVKSNPYKTWRKKNAKVFKNSYEKERIEFTYDQVITKINSIPNEAIKRRATEILTSAQRWSESCQDKTIDIIGKGSKKRPNLRSEVSGPDYNQSYHTFYRALKKVGLKPHTLRKIALTRLVDNGASSYDLMEVAGWSSVQSASSYVQPKSTDRLKALLSK